MSFIITSYLVLFLAACAFKSGYILGGEDAEITDWPFMVSLQQSTEHFCGGVLIDSTHVLTAAHCIEWLTP